MTALELFQKEANENGNIYEVVNVYGIDEISEGFYKNKEEAIATAEGEYGKLCKTDKKNNRYEVREYDEFYIDNKEDEVDSLEDIIISGYNPIFIAE